MNKIANIELKPKVKELNLNPKLKVISVCENHNGDVIIGTRGSSILIAKKDVNYNNVYALEKVNEGHYCKL